MSAAGNMDYVDLRMMKTQPMLANSVKDFKDFKILKKKKKLMLLSNQRSPRRDNSNEISYNFKDFLNGNFTDPFTNVGSSHVI